MGILRPRATSLETPVLVRRPMSMSVHAEAQRGGFRYQFLCLLTFGGVFYATLLMIWSINHFRLLAVHDVGSFRADSVQIGSRDVGTDKFRLVMAKLLQTSSPPPFVQEDTKSTEEHALSVQVMPTGRDHKRRLRCIAWRATDDCDPVGPRAPTHDKPCREGVSDGASGYCEVEDVDSGELFRVMQRHCNSVQKNAFFRCEDAEDFVNFPLLAGEFVEAQQPDGAQSNTESRYGIVMVVYPKLIPSVHATIRALRDIFGCRLPIELWYRGKEMRNMPGSLEAIHQLTAEDAGITFQSINDSMETGFTAKIHAIYYSSFERVLYLDGDNVPARDPTLLFTSPEFVQTGAMFWPDFWHPDRTIFNIHAKSLLWELLDMPFVDMFEQESGQLLINKRRHAEALALTYFYAFHQPSHFSRLRLVYGDKDLFRLAWLKVDASFHMIQTPPAIAGKVIGKSFCGMTMVQHDVQGKVLFLHRNSHKLMGEPWSVNQMFQAAKRAKDKTRLQKEAEEDGVDIPWDEIQKTIDEKFPKMKSTALATEPPEPDGYPDAAIWTHLLSFRGSSRREYVMASYSAAPEFPEAQRCYGQREVDKHPQFQLQKVSDLSFAGLETHVRRFAMGAAQQLKKNRARNKLVEK